MTNQNSWLAMNPGQFTDQGTQAGLFAVDSQGRLGGDLFSEPEPDGGIDWCCASAGEIAAYLARTAPGMTDEEIGWLPRPVQARARAARSAAAAAASEPKPCKRCGAYCTNRDECDLALDGVDPGVWVNPYPCEDISGAIGADGSVYSDADPGL